MKVNVPQTKEWKKQREKRWKEVWQDAWWIETKAEQQTLDANKVWYIEGDLAPLMSLPDNVEKQCALQMVDVMQLCPITDVEEYLDFFQKYALWASQQKLSYWGNDLQDRDKRFIVPFFSRYVGDHTDSTKDIYEHMLKLFLPNDEGVITFPFKLGNDNWQPQLEIALCDSAFDILHRIRRYLFNADSEYRAYSHIKPALPLVRYIKDLNIEYFATKILEGKLTKLAPPPAPRCVSGAGQELFRGVIGNLLGYKNDYNDYKGALRHNDLEFEQQVRELLEGLPMPEEYHRLVDFIHAHPDDYEDRSE